MEKGNAPVYPAVSDVKSWAKAYDVGEGTGKPSKPESIHRLLSV